MKKYTIDLTTIPATADLKATLTARLKDIKKEHAEGLKNAINLLDARTVAYLDPKKPKTTAKAIDYLVDIVTIGEDKKPKTTTIIQTIPMRSLLEKDKRSRATEALQAIADLSADHATADKAIGFIRTYLNCLYLTAISAKIDNADTNRILRHAFILDKAGNGKANASAVAIAIEDTANRIAKGKAYIDLNDLVADLKAKAKAEAEAEKATAEALKAKAKAEAEALTAKAKAEAEALKAKAKAEAEALTAKAKAEAEALTAKAKAEAEAKPKAEAKKAKAKA